jgi:phage shock protein PspC (stress-responsive transcriptional regulator)
MELTAEQETRITRYIRDVAKHLDPGLSKPKREQCLLRLEERIGQLLATVADGAVQDTDIEAVLARFGAPARVASQLVAGQTTVPSPRALVYSQRVWLGVCASLALRTNLEVWMVRALALFLGLFTGPLAILLYIGLYLEMYLSGRERNLPAIDYPRVALRTAAAFVAVLLLHLASAYSLRLIAFVHEQVLNRPIPPLGDWGWMQYYSGTLFFWMMAAMMPLAALSGMPLANAWDQSLKRAVQAIGALYGVAISLGIASNVVGILLDVVEDFTR